MMSRTLHNNVMLCHTIVLILLLLLLLNNVVLFVSSAFVATNVLTIQQQHQPRTFVPILSKQRLYTVARPRTSSLIRSVVTESVSVLSSSSSTSTTSTNSSDDDDPTNLSDVGVVILAGGTGSRMKASLPKQFLILNKQPILHYSIQLFLETLLPNKLHHVVLVLDPKYQSEYQYMITKYNGRLSFANPGKERQGSVENGLNKLIEMTQSQTSSTSTTTTTTTDGNDTKKKPCTYVAIHDSARPLVTVDEVMNVIYDARTYGAAVLSVPCKATIKESNDNGQTVFRTIPRERLYEVHTPQVIRIDLLQYGFEQVTKNNWVVTDDVSIIEQLQNETVKLTLGQYTNIKITTPEDMNIASAILRDRKKQQKHQQRQQIISKVQTILMKCISLINIAKKQKQTDFQI